MSRRAGTTPVATLLLAALAACSKATSPPREAGIETNAATMPVDAPTAPSVMTAPMRAVSPQQPPGDDPATFVPLGSEAVKNAIHRALRTGQTQRWRDGKLSGYAVPSLTTAANGCRAVRYTVDQRVNAAFETINACDASR